MTFKILLSLIVVVNFLQPLFIYGEESIEEVELEITQLVKEVEKKNKELEAINDEVSQVKSKLAELSEKQKTFEKDIVMLKKNYDLALVDANQALVILQKLNNTNLWLELEIAEDGTIKSDYFRNVSMLNMITQNKMSEIEKLSGLKKQLESSNKSYEKSIKEHQESQIKLQEQQEKIEKIVNESQEDVDTLNQKLAILEVEQEINSLVSDGNGYLNKEQQEKILQAANISPEDYIYVNFIIFHESTWNFLAVNSSSGAYGLCQALPASKLASAGDDWKTNPITQMKWCNDYAIERYGTWQKAHEFWTENKWW